MSEYELHPTEKLAEQYGYSNPEYCKPLYYEHFRDPMTLFATIAADHECMVGDYTMKGHHLGDGQYHYVFYHGDVITAFCGPSTDNGVGYSGFVHVGG